MLHFDVGICVHTQEEMNSVYELILSTYPEAKGIKRGHEQRIELPMITISFLLMGHCRGYRFDKIYYSDNANIIERNEILAPMLVHTNNILINLRPISQLYEQFDKEFI